MKSLRVRDAFLLPVLLSVLVISAWWPVLSTTRLPGGDLSDTVHQGFPFLGYTYDSIREGRIPHWNPYIFCGVPFYSSFSAPVFYPLRGLPLMLLGPEASLRFLFPVHMFLGGLFAWLFLGSIGTGRAGRYFGTLAYAAGCWAATLFYAGHGSKVISWSYLPLLLYACESWLGTRRAWFVVLGGISLGMTALASHPQMLLYSGLAALLWSGFRIVEERGWRNILPAALGLAGMVAAGGALGAVQLVPGIEFSRYSTRGQDLSQEQSESYSLPPEESLTMLFPHLFGYRHGFPGSMVSGVPLYWGRLGLRLSSEFVGVTVALLAAAGFILSRARGRMPLLAIMITGLLISWGGYTPLYSILYDTIPLFRKIRAPHMAAFLTTSAVALMSGPGLEALAGTRRRIWAWAGGFAVLSLVMAAAAGPLLEAGQRAASMRLTPDATAGALARAAEIRTRMAGADFLRAGVAASVVAASAWLLARRRIGAGQAAVVLTAVSALELVPVIRDFQVFVPHSRLEDCIERRDDLALAAGPGRVFPGDNALMASRIRSVTGYHAAKPEVTDGLLAALDAGGFPAFRQTAWTVIDDPSGILTYADTRQMLIAQAAGPDSLLADSLGSAIPAEPMPRAFLAASWIEAAPGQMLDAAASGYAPEAVTLVEDGPPSPAGPVRGSATITRDDPETVVVRTVCDTGALLVLADTWYPLWRVEIDGEPAALLRANYWMRAASVPAGTHEVTFRFDSRSFTAGLFVSILAAAGALGAGIAEAVSSRKRR
jgi:hypothetical protein